MVTAIQELKAMQENDKRNTSSLQEPSRKRGLKKDAEEIFLLRYVKDQEKQHGKKS